MLLSSKNALKYLLSIMLLICLLKMPYGYFQLVRFIAMSVFIWFAYLEERNKDKSFTIIWIALAILVNPIFKIALGRTIWNVIDVILAVFIITSIWLEKSRGNTNNQQKKDEEF